MVSQELKVASARDDWDVVTRQTNRKACSTRRRFRRRLSLLDVSSWPADSDDAPSSPDFNLCWRYARAMNRKVSGVAEPVLARLPGTTLEGSAELGTPQLFRLR
jgi:hypothetical protein